MKDPQPSGEITGIELISSVIGTHVRTIMAHYLCGVKRENMPSITARDLAEFILDKLPPEDSKMIPDATHAVEICILDVMRNILQDLEGGPRPDYSHN